MNRKAGPDSVTHVAAGILFDERGRVLVQRRPDHAHAGGLWEFPGGKADHGEAREVALARELKEELDVVVEAARPLISIRHAYPEKTVHLDVWRIDSYSGTPRPMEGQPLDWVAIERLPELAMPAADTPIVNAVRLPDTCLVTGDAPDDDEAFLERLEARLASGTRLVQLRTRRTGRRLESLSRRAAELCEARGAWLILNGEPARARDWGAHGVHLNAVRLAAARERPVPEGFWLSSACHDSAELERAEALGVDFVLASPVAATTSHPGAEPIGFDGLRAICRQAAVPVYALGGMSGKDRESAWRSGAQGVAGISGFW